VSEKAAILDFIGVDPARRLGGYRYEAVENFFLEILVDGQRYRIDVGDIGANLSDGKPRRGIHINFPLGGDLGDRSLNAVNIANPDQETLPRSDTRAKG